MNIIISYSLIMLLFLYIVKLKVGKKVFKFIFLNFSMVDEKEVNKSFLKAITETFKAY